ncbi:MAG: RNA methyltransferase [Bacilli bacterium]|nr:RNA methyltransferase [Bacilli bacterium]
MEIITSLQNDKIKQLNKLNEKKYRDESNLFLVEGEHLVNEAYQTNQLTEVLVTNESDSNLDIKTTLITQDVMKKLSKMQSPSNIIGVCKKFNPIGYGKRIILLDGIQDPGNLGTIIRSAMSFNIDTVVLGEDTVDLYNDKVIRASEGMIFHIDVLRKNLNDFILELKDNNYTIYTTDVNGGKIISDVDFKEKCAIILGHEGKGVGDIRLLADESLYIPMNKKCESLNVSVAASIIMYEMSKRDYE